MLPPRGDAENTGLSPGLRAQSSTLRTKMVLPKQAQRRQVKNNPEQHTKPPLGEGNSFPGTWWAYFPVPFLLEKEAEGLAASGFGRRVPVARHPGRQATRGYQLMLCLHPLFWGGERVWGNNPPYIQGWCAAASVGCGQNHQTVTPAGFTDGSSARPSSPTSTRSAQCLLELCVLTLINLLASISA